MLDNHAAHRGLDAEERQLVISQLPPGLITRGMSQDWGPPRHCKTSSSTSFQEAGVHEVEQNSAVSKNEHCCNMLQP